MNDLEDDGDFESDTVLGLVLVPARELANQVYKVMSQISIKHALKLYLAVGGNKLEDDLENLKKDGCNLIVGTVGRVWDLIQRGTISLK